MISCSKIMLLFIYLFIFIRKANLYLYLESSLSSLQLEVKFYENTNNALFLGFFFLSCFVFFTRSIDFITMQNILSLEIFIFF